ncbi:murein biosynthesis integral membrane protein MurJ [Crenobacter sp. SG2303]|uniref:Probable lipid II flippase MurJ n=1 Tax=Crenobacter oryzisoli TaxID=3056844 RepID=A0ABT7XM83_9NEIS|nr:MULTISPECIES: murein biosynthesis integral membrane protein MurJ [unclassified Crenobacter]MDN0074913.1 murein biosynthesis integral membrane protein MurJ [Crenobacter sp. SG2303]MDN0081509.1 murein biosynthesis integral membrane protein MurJ [Crenobacter sp. SG2305]
MNLLKALATVSSMTLVSRILGFARDAIIARVFGASVATDAFYVAFKLPNLLRRIFAEGAFSQAFVPVLAEYKQQRTDDETRHFLAHIAGLLSLILLIVTVIGIIAAPAVVWISAPGFANEPDKFALTVKLLQVTFPYILFISLSSLASSVLNTWNMFSVPAFTPTFLNISFIICALFLAPYFHPPIMVLGWGVFLGGVAQLLYQLPYLKKVGMLTWPRLNLKDAAVWRVVKQMGPAIFGVSISQISLVINTIFASYLVSGSVSWMYYADRLMEFPTGILGVALGTILLPSLAKHAANRSLDEYSKLLDWGIRLSLLLALPASVALAILSKPLIATLFMYGKFSAFDAAMTQRALIAYAIGLVGLILVKVLAPGFYARQNIKTPVKIAIFTLAMTQLMNLAFVWPLKHAGLSLAIGLGACLNAGLLLTLLIRHRIYMPQPGWKSFAGKTVVAVIGMAVVLLVLDHLLPTNWHGHSYVRVGWLTTLIVAGAASYFAFLFALGFRFKDFARREH